MPSLSFYHSNLPTIDSGVLSLGQVKHAIILMSTKVINWVRNMPRVHFRWSFIPSIQLVKENQVGDKASEQPNKIKKKKKKKTSWGNLLARQQKQAKL